MVENSLYGSGHMLIWPSILFPTLAHPAKEKISLIEKLQEIFKATKPNYYLTVNRIYTGKSTLYCKIKSGTIACMLHSGT